METRLSTKGQIVVPSAVRNRLKLGPGDRLKVEVDEQRIVLTPMTKRRYRVRLIEDPVSGWPVLSAGPKAPKLTSEEVARLLVDFP